MTRRRAVAVVERGGRVLIITRDVDGHDDAALPDGVIDDGRRAEDGALRELWEGDWGKLR